MPKATTFIFKNYDIDMPARVCRFRYEIAFENGQDLQFEETLEFPEGIDFGKLEDETLNAYLRGIHLVLGVSYYKLYVPRNLEIPYSLDQFEAEFWNKIYHAGLGEFVYRNGLDFDVLAKFSADKTKFSDEGVRLSGWDYKKLISDKKQTEDVIGDKNFLIGIGGGKDSIVMMEKLKDFGYQPTTFVLETQKGSDVIDKVIEKAGLKSLKVRRYLDSKIFEEHPGSYNGHVPISAIIAFVGTFMAELMDFDYFVVGNEISSNFGNLEYQGRSVNHQWSKSQEFETLFRNYTLRNFGDKAQYFSLLRCYYELRIVKEFVNYPEYFGEFTSCNRAFKVHKERSNKLWCGECSKCAFLFLMLAAFLEPKELELMFGANLFDSEGLQVEFKELLGLGTKKPFDCVGTFEECRVALLMAEKNGYGGTLIMQNFLENTRELVDENLITEVLKIQEAPLLPPELKLRLADSVVIVGYGREGKVTEAFLNKHFKDLNVEIADENLDKDYLDKVREFDLAIKTPGLPGSKMPIRYITATQLFFSLMKKKVLMIGITGSKGKSTTTTLIYELLKKHNLPTYLLGNIGVPMLEILDANLEDDAIVVLELSSYQLQELTESPDVSVLLNLFPEHLDYHGSKGKYYDAKLNIVRYQSNKGLVFYPKLTLDSEAGSEIEGMPTNGIDYLSNQMPERFNLKLLGEHNLRNVKAASMVASLLGVSEDEQKEVCESFIGLKHRLEFVGEFDGIKFYDDAISTTPESTIAALESIDSVQTIFLGGTDRGYNFEELCNVLKGSEVKNIVLFPESGARILDNEDAFNVLRTDSMEEAVKFAFLNTEKGKTCLLSTASPSYSLWKNFEEKGDQFAKYVRLFGTENSAKSV